MKLKQERVKWTDIVRLIWIVVRVLVIAARVKVTTWRVKRRVRKCEVLLKRQEENKLKLDKVRMALESITGHSLDSMLSDKFK